MAILNYIVFVHGFTSHPEHTWIYKRVDCTRPKNDHDETSEPQSKSNPLKPLSKAPWNLLVVIKYERATEPARPLLYVAHSLGGVVIKELLIFRSIVVSTKGIIFFGIPHGGADPRGIFLHTTEHIMKAVEPRFDGQIINSFLPSSKRLQEWRIHSFQEQFGVKALNDYKVAEDPLSYLILPKIEITEHIGRNYMDMCGFSRPEDVEYKKVAAALRRMTAILPENQVPNPRPSLTRKQRQQLRDSLRFDKIDARLMNIKNPRAGTCQWLMENHTYLDRLDLTKFRDRHGLLFIKGKSGARKSTLMKHALAQARRTLKDGVFLSFFFNTRGQELEKTIAGMYRSLLLQLLCGIPEPDVVFDSLSLTVWPQDGRMQWSVESLEEVFCFIDALDECAEVQVRDMLSFFESLDQKAHDQDITNCVVSELKIGHDKFAEG
ncbi:hypothetical protein F5Y19DRAFT_464647 [Xylariaceae sp. FL1651]|nr:hypothetical protein F5Y19DRAFT_464647 [Xylariaceae sp. FL1651]